MLIVLYHSLVQSHITYGLLIWGGTYKTTIAPLELIQKRILKTILRKPQIYPSQLTFTETDVMTIKQLYMLEICKYTFHHRIDKLNHPHATRLNTKISVHTSTCHKSVTKNFFQNQISKVFNILPDEIKHTTYYKRYIIETTKWVKNHYK